jgi:hypothetical protein
MPAPRSQRRCRCTAFPRTKIIVWHHFDSSPPHFLSQTVAVEADAAVINFAAIVSVSRRNGRICSESDIATVMHIAEVENVDILQSRQYGVALLPRIIPEITVAFIHFCFAGDIAEHLMSGEGCASFSWGCLSL